MVGPTPIVQAKERENGQRPERVRNGAQQPGAAGRAADILALHDTAGNQAVGKALRNGQPLEATTRSQMESEFGHDLGNVRVHTDNGAAEKTNRFDAEAVTIGSNIYFARDSYHPQTIEGRMVLAHELAHVVQGSGNNHSSPAPKASLEAEATAASLPATAGMPATVNLRARPSTPLSLTREDRRRRGRIGSIIGLGLVGAGLGVAALLGATLGAGVVLAALGGGFVLGGLLGFMKRRDEPVTVQEADQLIRGRFGNNLAAAIAAGVSATGANLQVLEDAPFRAAYLAWGGAAADVEVVGGFVDRRQNPPAVVLHKGRVKTVTVLHEALHIYSDDALRTDAGILASVVGSNYVNEGFTQYFTEQIADEQYLSIEGIGDDYRAAAREVAALTDVPGVSEEMLRRAYFEGDVAGLRAAVDAAHGADTFDNWAAAINARNWDGARRTARGR